MAYTKNLNKNLSHRTRSNTHRISSESFSAENVYQKRAEFYELEAAEVVDVILTADHPQFKSYDDIGKAKIRFIHSQYNTDEDALVWAKPKNNSLRLYPVKHEIVIGVNHLNQFFYDFPLNTTASTNNNEVKNLSIDDSTYTNKEESERKDAELGFEQSENNDDASSVKNDDIRPLQPYEGDLIVEGRFGNSIRLSRNQDNKASNIKIRVGQNSKHSSKKRNEYFNEHLDEDASSLYLVENESVEYTPTTVDSDVHLQNVATDIAYEGNQIVLATGRMILNAKEALFAFAKGSVHLTTSSEFTVDAQDNITIHTLKNKIDIIKGYLDQTVDEYQHTKVKEKVSYDVPKMYLGEDENEDQPIVLGQVLVDLLNDMVTWLDQHKHFTPSGPSGPPIPPLISMNAATKIKVEAIKSKRNYTM